MELEKIILSELSTFQPPSWNLVEIKPHNHGVLKILH